MLDAIIRFFETNISDSDGETTDSGHAVRLATAALLVEVMHMDRKIEDTELRMVEKIVIDDYGLSQAEADELIDLAQQEIDDSTDYYQFTSLINNSMELADKVKIIEDLWRIAFADNQLDCYEEHMIRKVAELLYVPHREFIAAKHRAKD